MAHGPRLVVRDPLHGLIRFSELEERVINTGVLQRLRGISQLAMANLVYPGCRHSRFEHSLGVMHVAGLMAEQLKLPPKSRDIVRLSALLHDVGHGPFSHVSEQLLEEYAVNLPDGLPRNKLHEEVTINIIERNPELSRILSDDQRARIIKILDTHRYPLRTPERDIVSGPLDADKLDYILRDSYFAGVQYGVFDLDHIIRSLIAIECGGDECHIGITDDGVSALEQMLFARYHMTRQVYQHKVRAITDAMIVEGVRAAIAAGCDEARAFYAYDHRAIDGFIANYMSATDRSIVDVILASPHAGDGKELFERLRDRRLLKRVFKFEITEIFDDAVKRANLTSDLSDAGKRAELRSLIATCVASPEPLVIVDYQSEANPTYRQPGPQITPRDILVRTQLGDRKLLHEVSQIINSYREPQREYLAVYCPVDENKRSARKAQQQQLREAVHDAIQTRYA